MPKRRLPLRVAKEDKKLKIAKQDDSSDDDNDCLDMTLKTEETIPVDFEFKDMKFEYSYGIAVILRTLLNYDSARDVAEYIANQGNMLIYIFLIA